MKFVDEATITVRAGDGGDGCVAFRREAHVPFGGPAGGDGGRGGDIVLVADSALGTLADFQYRRQYKAPRGENGRGKQQYGRSGETLILPVPVGTEIWDTETDTLLGDLTEKGQQLLVAKGGDGGRGNMHFRSPVDQAPQKAEGGTPGEKWTIRLTLKLIAQVGLVGFPSVGKSSIIRKVSRAKPKVAEYHFTTLRPNLGVVAMSDHRIFTIADIPGLIEGAADGAGLGHQFLRHIERTELLVHVLDPLSEIHGREPLSDWEKINQELFNYSSTLKEKEQILVVNKCDSLSPEQKDELTKVLVNLGQTPYFISALSGEGLDQLLEVLWSKLQELKPRDEWESLHP